MQTIKVIIDADDEVRALRLACSNYSDQTEDHFATLCGILAGHLIDQSPQVTNNMINSIVNHFAALGTLQPHDILDCCLRLYAKLSLQCLYNPQLKGVTTVYLLETYPHLIMGVVCYYEGRTT